MQIVATIVPIFIIVLLGWVVHRRGFLPGGFIEPANRLVYYVAIPAMIFRALTQSTSKEWFNPLVIALTLIALATTYLFAWAISRVLRMARSLTGTFIQSSGHGNLGYIGLAVVYYFLGEKGLVHASVIAGFMMILQNILSVVTLQLFAPDRGQSYGFRDYGSKVMSNPVIVSVVAGMVVSGVNIPMPLIIQRSLAIIGGLALPTALLIIGASLSLRRIRAYAWSTLGAAVVKLIVMPALGWWLYRLCHLSAGDTITGLILLASPTATISYVMAKEMNGSPDLAVATVSASTLLSAVTLMLWLTLVSGYV